MTRLVVDGGERADTWEHLAAGDAPGDRDFTVTIDRWLGSAAQSSRTSSGPAGRWESASA